MGRDWNCSIKSFYPWIQMKDNFKKPSRKKKMGFCVVLTVALLKSNLRKNAALIRTSPCSGRTVVHPGHCPVKCCFLEGEALIMICNSCTKDHDPILQKNCTQKSWPNTSRIAQRRAISMLHKITHKSVISWVKTRTENCTQKVHHDQPTHNFCNLMIRPFWAGSYNLPQELSGTPPDHFQILNSSYPCRHQYSKESLASRGLVTCYSSQHVSSLQCAQWHALLLGRLTTLPLSGVCHSLAVMVVYKVPNHGAYYSAKVLEN